MDNFSAWRNYHINLKRTQLILWPSKWWKVWPMFYRWDGAVGDILKWSVLFSSLEIRRWKMDIVSKKEQNEEKKS